MYVFYIVSHRLLHGTGGPRLAADRGPRRHDVTRMRQRHHVHVRRPSAHHVQEHDHGAAGDGPQPFRAL